MVSQYYKWIQKGALNEIDLMVHSKANKQFSICLSFLTLKHKYIWPNHFIVQCGPKPLILFKVYLDISNAGKCSPPVTYKTRSVRPCSVMISITSLLEWSISMLAVFHDFKEHFMVFQVIDWYPVRTAGSLRFIFHTI